MNTNERRFSVIMTVYDQARELEENLPAFLQQEYEPGYEVIVIDETSTDDTSDVLKLLKNDYPHLYSTFLPKPSIDVTRKKFAFNLGLKAAKNKWVIFTNVSMRPESTDILKAISETMDQQTELTLGYIGKKDIRLQPFTSYQEARSHILKSERKLKKVREYHQMNYTWGRYNFIIIRKDFAYELLKLYEQRISAFRLAVLRMSILWSNFIRRSSTTLLTME